MGYHYGSKKVLAKKDKLRDEWWKAERELEAFAKSYYSPPGSFRWEDAIHSSNTIESMKEKVRQAKETYLNYLESEEYRSAIDNSMATKCDFFRR